VAANALVKRHPRRRYTWIAPDGDHRNQIDYMLAQRRWISSVCKCRSYPGADIDSDHVLVAMKLRLKLQRLKKRACRVPSYDFSDAKEYEVEVSNRFQSLEIPEVSAPNAADRMWDSMKAIMLESANKTLSKKRGTAKREWITPETFALIEEKRNCVRGSIRYRELKREVRRMLRHDRNAHLESICKQVEELERTA